MNTISEPLLDAKLQAAEARTEARVVRLETLVENSIKNNERAIAESKEIIAEVKNDFKNAMHDFKQDSKNTRTTVVVTAITSTLTIFFGIAGLVVAMQSNMIGSFNVGQATKETITTEVAKQTNELKGKIDSLSEKFDSFISQNSK